MDGKVRLHDPAKRYLPGVGVPPESNAQSGWLEELTLRHLATQTGGFEKTRGWCHQLKRPGTAWIYSDGGPNWLADCLTMAYGRDLLAVMNERVFHPLGITVGDTPTGGDHDLYWGFNHLLKPFLLPICQSVAHGAPYPPSPVVTSIAWAPPSRIKSAGAEGESDIWVTAWADDGHLYMAWGDGWGFDKNDGLHHGSMGLARIEGGPDNFRGIDFNSEADCCSGQSKDWGEWGRKPCSLLMVDEVLYMWVRNANNDGTGEQSHLGWSTDRGRHWQWADWKWEQFGFPNFIDFGRNWEDTSLAAIDAQGHPGAAGGWGESQRIPSKWISADGKTIHLIFSGENRFKVRKAELTVVRE